MIVHIGYHKTGTTYLQSQLFPHLKGVNYVDVMDDDCIVVASESSHLDVNWDEVAKRVSSWGEEPLLHSAEQLTGPLFYHTGLGKTDIADRLKELGTTKVIITIRDQIKLIDSCYRQYIQEGGTLTFNAFWKEWKFAPNPLHFDFFRLISYYVDLYGKENVLVIPNEWMIRDEAKVIQMIEQFTGGTYTPSSSKPRANKSLSNLGISFLRFTNKFTYSAHAPSTLFLPKRITTWKMRRLSEKILDPWFFSKLSKRESYVSSSEANEYSNLFRQGNKALNKLYDLNLDELGYPM